MAIYSKKSKDASEVALSAIQDALNIRDGDANAPGAAAPATPAAPVPPGRRLMRP